MENKTTYMEFTWESGMWQTYVAYAWHKKWCFCIHSTVSMRYSLGNHYPSNNDVTLCEQLSSVYLNVSMLTSFTCIWFSVTMSTTSEIISLVVLFLDSYTVFDSVVRLYWIHVISNNYLKHCQVMNIIYHIFCRKWTSP